MTVGRSLTDLLGFLTDLHAKGIDLFLHQQGLDTSTPSGRATFHMLGVFAEFERAMIRERVMSGLARARAEGKRPGRRKVEQSHGSKVKAALTLRSRGLGIRRIAREVALERCSGSRMVRRSKPDRWPDSRMPVPFLTSLPRWLQTTLASKRSSKPAIVACLSAAKPLRYTCSPLGRNPSRIFYLCGPLANSGAYVR